MQKLLAAVLMAIALSGCASFQTRVTCTLSHDEARVDSKWGLFGISTKIAPSDAKVLCKL